MNAAVQIGLTDREQQKFSLARWMRGVVERSWGAQHAGFELAVAAELQRAFPNAYGGLPLTNEIMGRTLTSTGGTATGGAIVQTTVSEDWWAPALRAQSKLIGLGATVVESSSSVAIPRLKPGTTAGSVAENASRADSDPTFELVTYTPQTIRSQMVATKRLLSIAPVAEAVIRDDLVRGLAEMVDQKAIQGTGTNEPLGILNTSGISVVALGVNGGAPTYAMAIDCLRQVSLKKGVVGQSIGWVTNTKGMATMRSVTKLASWGFLWDDAQQPEYDGWMLGYPAMVSENVPSNLVKGTSGAVCSALVFGNFADLWIINFSPPTLAPDAYTYSNTGAVRFNVYQEVDIRPRRVDSFSMVVDMLAS